MIGNDLAQHPELSLLAIGLACYIQSVRPGTAVDIKTLAARFPEGPTRIAAALRELETHGYLRRSRERTATGRIVTRTVSSNRPGHRAARETATRRSAARRTSPDEPAPRKHLPAVPPALVPRPRPPPDSRRRARQGCAATTPRLLLSATDAEHLAPGVAAWLERDLTPHRRTPRPDREPAERAPDPPGRPPRPPPGLPGASPAAVPAPGLTCPRAPPSPPDLRRLRPRLPGA
ncbi:hypothetical protein GCM10020295_40540 [Streptomyces cinereospinus]